MTARPRVADYMAHNLVTLRSDMEITRAMSILLSARFSGAPVVDASKGLVGVLSKKDCLRACLNAAYHGRPGGTVADYMSVHVATIDADSDIVTACERFLDTPYRRFPVMREGQLVGQISRADVLRALTEQWQ